MFLDLSICLVFREFSGLRSTCRVNTRAGESGRTLGAARVHPVLGHRRANNSATMYVSHGWILAYSRPNHQSELFFRERPLGQNDNCTDEVTFDCLVGAITGKVQASYWTTADRLKLDRTQKSPRTLASASVPPLVMNSRLTFKCLNSN